MRRIALAVLCLFVAIPVTRAQDVVAPKEVVPLGTPEVNLPLTHENLAVYILENPSLPDKPKKRPAIEYLTLEEGLRFGQVRVSEKGQAEVNELTIDNWSNQPLFVQAGDVVRGGHQDRAIAADLVIPPKTRHVPVPSFCVEHDRWSGMSTFGSTTGLVIGAQLRSAIQKEKDQQKVWDAVAEAKAKLIAVNSLRESESGSLNEQILDSAVQRRLGKFMKELGKACDKTPKAVGLVTAINGKLSTSDVYADAALFKKLFPRLLASAALEAMSTPVGSTSAPTAREVTRFLIAADHVQPARSSGMREDASSLQFRFLSDKVELHRQALAK
jgi:hypothetical protein